MSASRMEIRRVVTSFIEHDGKILILRRSGKVGTYRGRWAGVSGYIEGSEAPLDRALREIEEEVGLKKVDVKLVGEGKPLVASDEQSGFLWIVHPYLFRTETSSIKTDWEHREHRWIRPVEIVQYETVPKLKETLERVLPGLSKKFLLDQEVVEQVDGVKLDRTHGASQLARLSLEVMRSASERCKAASVEDYVAFMKAVVDELLSTRPSMASITNYVGKLFFEINRRSMDGDLSSVRGFTKARVDELIGESEAAFRKAAEHASRLIEDGTTILTHSYSSTTMETMRQAVGFGKRFSVLVTESRPLFEGRRTSGELSKLGVPVTLIVDSAVGCLLESAKLVLVGADSILSDGSVVNKAGTYLIALAARDRGVPFYVVSEKHKFNVRSYIGEKIVLEEKDPSEIVGKEALPSVSVRNIYFDITPAKYVTEIITESGPIRAGEVAGHMGKMLEHTYIG